MSYIRTFFKDIDPKDLGFTYSHEHIVCVPQYWKEKNEDDLLLDDPEKSLLDVMDFKNLGGKTIVDATAIDYGRDVEAVAEISKKTDIQIIGTAGFNKRFLWSAGLTDRLRKVIGNYSTYIEWIEDKSINELADFVAKEVEIGLEGTNYKAGQVKFGTWYNSISPLEEKTIRAVARAHKITKAPIHSHTEAGTMALEQIEILESEGIDIGNVSFGHMDRNLDIYYYEEILSKGAYLSFDGIGKIKYAPESARINTILELCKRGYSDKILISGDTARKSYYKHYDYGLGLEYIIKKWIPIFIEEANAKGLDGRTLIMKFFIENPMKNFTFKR